MAKAPAVTLEPVSRHKKNQFEVIEILMISSPLQLASSMLLSSSG